MSDSTLNPVALAQSVKSGLIQIRRILVHSPAALSLDSVGPSLEQLRSDLKALNSAPNLPSAEVLLEIQALANSVQGLYRQASIFYGGLAAESIKHGNWDAASYSQGGEWAQPQANPAKLLRVEG